MLNALTISDLRAKLAKREVSAREVLLACLERVLKVDDQIHAFLSYDEQDALAQADAADKLLASDGADQALLGIPVGIKDVIAVKNQPLGCGSKILDKFVSPYDATKFESMRDPQLVRIPFVQKMSLCASGTPVSGPPSPRAMRASARRASASARSPVTVTKALSAGLARSIRSRKWRVTSTLEYSRALSPRPISVAVE